MVSLTGRRQSGPGPVNDGRRNRLEPLGAVLCRQRPGVGALLLGSSPMPPVSRQPPAAPLLPAAGTTTFANNMVLPVHRWFRYSAGYSAAWAAEVIREQGAQTVLDPFAGSGTTLLAAQVEGAESIGLDAHPFVTRVASAKLNWDTNADLLREEGRAILEKARNHPVRTPGQQADLITKIYAPSDLLDLLSIKKALETSEATELSWLALISILRKCSHAGTAQWQYVLPNKSKARVAEPFKAYGEQISLMANDMEAMQRLVPAPPTATLLTDDVRDSTAVPRAWADLVLTSPPYANNYDYADATRLEMSFLGEVVNWSDLKGLRSRLVRSSSQAMSKYDPEYVLEEAPEVEPIRAELKAAYNALSIRRLEMAGKKSYNTMAVAYFHDLGRAWTTIHAATSESGRACFVVGDSAPYGVHLPVERWLGELAVGAGFSSWHFNRVRTRNDKWKNRKHTVPLQEGHLWVEN
jgi:hypothetical protein